jgi:uncharacterized protein YjbI with pentapeptide repeats
LPETLWVKAKATGAIFDGAKLPYADFSYCLLESASFRDADLMGANLHAIQDRNANWNGASTNKARRTDEDRLAAETWKPPPE